MEKEKTSVSNASKEAKPAVSILKNAKPVGSASEKFEIKPGHLVHVKGSGQTTGTAGMQVGTVDHLEGSKFIKLDKVGSPEGKHRWVPIDWVEKVDGKCVYLKKSETEFLTGVLKEAPKTEEAEKKMAV